MSASPNLRLPYLDANQNQKSVTHNAALRMLDALVNLHVAATTLSAPPAAPADGQCWIVASGGTGAWLGKDLNVAAWQDGAWIFYAPNPGFVAYVDALGGALMWNGTAWVSLIGVITSLALNVLGIGTTADPSNPLSAKLNAALFSALPTSASPAGTGDVRVKLSKQAAGNTATLLFQDGYSGRAEIGLAGDDNFHVKVSPDGATFYEAMVVTAAGGGVSFLATPTAPTASQNDNSTRLATTAYADRAASAGNLARRQVADAATAVLASDRVVAVVSLTAARTLTLPAASAFPGGATLTVLDESGACSAVNALTVAASGSDTINGGASAALTAPYTYLALESNTSNKWTVVDSPSGSVGSLNGGALAGTRNRLINGNFVINQRAQVSGSALAAGAYGHDRWKAGAGGCTYTFTAGTPDTAISIAAGTLQQVVETVNVEGGPYTMSWTGSATGRVTYTATGAGSATTTAYAASPILLPAVNAGLAVTVEFATGTLGKVQLEPGPIATPFERRFAGFELQLCQRYYETSYDLGTAPGTATHSGLVAAIAVGSGTPNAAASVSFKTPKRIDPAVLLWDGGGNAGCWSALASASTWSEGRGTAAVLVTAQAGFVVVNTTGLSAGLIVFCHFAASAEL